MEKMVGALSDSPLQAKEIFGENFLNSSPFKGEEGGGWAS
jgi:hypothetical protein